MKVRRYLILWLGFVLPTLAIGGLALALLAREQKRLDALADLTARERVQTIATNLDLIMAEIKSGAMQALQVASGPGNEQGRLQALVNSNPFVDNYTIQPPTPPVRGIPHGTPSITFPKKSLRSPSPQGERPQRPTRRQHARHLANAASAEGEPQPAASHMQARLRRQHIRNTSEQNIQTLSQLKADEMEKVHTPASVLRQEQAMQSVSPLPDSSEEWVIRQSQARSGWIESADDSPRWVGWYQARPNRRITAISLNGKAVLEELLAALPENSKLYLIAPNGEMYPTATLSQTTDTGEQQLDPTAPAASQGIVLPIGPELPNWSLGAADHLLPASNNSGFLLLGSLIVAALCAATLGTGTLLLLQARRDTLEASRKTSFVANVSHELRTPLTTICMYVEMLQEQRLSDENHRKRYLETIHNEAKRLSRLVDRVLDFNRLEQGKGSTRAQAKPLDAGQQIQAVLEALAPRLQQAQMQVCWQAPPSPILLAADADAFEQILLNLLDNAIKYAADGKRLSIELRALEKTCQLHIADYGSGIAAKDRQRVFLPFERLDQSLSRSSEGSGLGLAICQMLVHNMGGKIDLEPTANQSGCTVIVTLPLYPRT